jgi:DNA-directed RNA polymerase specialized sigma24 family protein
MTREELLIELWTHKRTITWQVKKALGPNRRHHQEDLVSHCYAELAKRIGQYKGMGKVLAWATRVVVGVTADWLDELVKTEDIVCEGNGTDPDSLPHYDSPFIVDKATTPSGAGPDEDEDLAEWAQGDVAFYVSGETIDKTEMTAAERAPNSMTPDEDGLVEMPPICTKMWCTECVEVQIVTCETSREEGENKVFTFTLACGHTREQGKKLKIKWKRKSRATGNPRGRPVGSTKSAPKINAAATL